MTLDPAVDLLLRGALAALFAWSARHKLADVDAFASAVRAYALLPSGTERAAAIGLAAAEIGTTAALLAPSLRSAGGLAAAALLVVYGAAIAINLARGRRDVDCGCLGPAHRQPLSEWLLARNALLAGAAAALLLPVGSRGLGWVDVLAIAPAWPALALLWIASNGLAAQWPRVKALRRTA